MNGVKRMPFLWNDTLVSEAGYHFSTGHFVQVPGELDMSMSVQESLFLLDKFLVLQPHYWCQ